MVVLDKLTYAGNLGTIKDEIADSRVRFVKGDIRNAELVANIFAETDIDYVVNFAAESHVDRSIANPQLFLETNILGTQNMLDCARKAWYRGKDSEGKPLYAEGKKFLQVSTDEVYGSLSKDYIDPQPLEITDADVRTAARIAQAEEFISAKPEGYESPIAQGGINVSGGQKQRLSIARAIAKHPKIYLFDDSFSALDYKTDVALRRALKAETGDATVIIVAQRISTVLHANQILVLEDGRIVGKGTHAQLMESCPAYQEIARSQLSNKELDLKGGEA
mgnify:CR=1 FL=1